MRAGKRYLSIVRWALLCTVAPKYAQLTWALLCTLAPKYAQITWTLFCTFAPKYAELATYFLCTLSINVLLNRQSLSKFWVQISTKWSTILFVFFYLAHSKKSPPVRPQPLPSKSLPSHYSLNITRSELLAVSSITCYIGYYHCNTKIILWNVTPCRL